VYGMINEAMRRLVGETAGADAWARIAERADTSESFAALSYYDDAITYSLVVSARVELGTPADDLLRGFGHYWSTRVGPENYSDILGATGTDVVGVLRNLDEMHARLQTLDPELPPPSFDVVDASVDAVDVHYRSDREGLAPFVTGLLEGLGDLYGTPATVELRSPKGQGQPYDVFLVSLGR
jgi:hypothetical protein